MSYDYSGDYYDTKSSKKSAKTPKRVNRGRALRECFLPFATACRRGETCRRIRFRDRNGNWTTSWIARVRGVCVQNDRCFPRNVLQLILTGGSADPSFETLANNCCQ